MAELDFSHHVSEIPAGQPLPEPYQRTERVQPTATPDIQGAISNYADATNWMSSVGSFVATKASNQIAQQLGSELGKNPRGDLGPVITDFDKIMHESYRTQAQATLGLQANKLITDANLETAKADRITPELINQTNENISIGLKNIFQHAPAEIVPHLQLQYGSLQLNQRNNLTERMIRQNKQDMQNTAILSVQTNTEHAYSFGLQGNDKAGIAAIESTKRLSDVEVAAGRLRPQDAKANVDAARKSYLTGKLVREYETARLDNKGEEYLKSVADNKSGLSDTDYMSVTQNLMAYVNRQNGLRNEAQSLALAKFQTSVALNPTSADIPQQLQDLQRNSSPEIYQKASLHLISALKTYNKEQGDVTQALGAWGNPTLMSRLGEKAVNQAFDRQVNSYVQQRQQAGNPISPEEAEVQVAASAGITVPVFRDTIKNRINSGNPQMMDIAARQMDALYSMNKGHALAGLSDSDKSIFTQFKSLRDALPPEEAAKVAIQNANQDPDTQMMNKQKWSTFVTAQTGRGTAPQKWALSEVSFKISDFPNPGIANEYGNMILNKYATFYQNMNGDQTNALKLVKQEVEQSFGFTGVNGSKVRTLHPIEKVLGYDENSGVVPFIQQDVINTLNKSFIPAREAFVNNKSNVYWQVVPQDMSNQAIFYGHEYAPIKVKRFTRGPQGIKSDDYDVMLIGNSFNWDISLKTDSGMRPLIQVAPYLGIQTYSPNKEAIDEAYRKSGKG